MKNTKKRLEFWKMLESNQFVKSTNSITDQLEEYPPAIQDMEAVIAIHGEFDKYAIDEWLTETIDQAVAEERKRIIKRAEKMIETNRFAGVPYTMRKLITEVQHLPLK